jgi:hypothetical protein
VLQAACSTGMTMSAADESMSRRAALAGILAGAVAVPSAAFAAENTRTGEKGKDPNWQLRQNQGITDVTSSSMAGTRTSAFGKSIFQNERNSKALARPGLSCKTLR